MQEVGLREGTRETMGLMAVSLDLRCYPYFTAGIVVTEQLCF
jgi:hypothetical protein